MRFRMVICLALGFLLFLPGRMQGSEASSLFWNSGKSVDAEIHGWPLKKLLGQLAASTGWKIYLDPSIDDAVHVSFKNRPQGEALRLLFAKLNYALIPEGGRPSRLYIYKGSMAGATSLVPPELASKPGNWLANEIIITLPPGSQEDIQALAKSLGGKVISSADDLNSHRLQFEDAAAAEKAREQLASRNDLQASDNYEFQRPALPGSAAASGFGNFGIDPTPVSRGEQITVAVVDTPVQALDGKMNSFLLPKIEIAGAVSELPDTPTHATSMIQTLLSSMALGDEKNVTGKVRVLPVDIYGNSEVTTTFEVARGLQAAIQANPNVINLSLGGTGYSPIVEQLLEVAYRKEIVVFASAGNTPTTEPTYPAASPNVIAVTAARQDGSIAPYANHGDFVDIKAPGSALVRYNGQTYISSGTSTATAFASGQAAAFTAQGLAPADVASFMLRAYDVNSPVQTASPATRR